MSRPFDEAKYQALSEGLEISEVGWSSMNEDIRFDAEYFRKRFLREETNLRKFRRHTLAEVAFVSDGQHGYFETDVASPIHMLAARNAKQWFADQEDAVPIAKWVDDKNQRSSLRENDIILSTRGTVGCCAIVGKDVLPANINQDVARLAIQHPDFLPEFVLAYLNSSYGQDWLQRNQTGMVQQGVCLQKLRNMPIPCLSSDFQASIVTHLHKTRDIIDASHATISSAETLLLTALGLENWQPTKKAHAEKSFEEFSKLGRLDAEYFQPKYDELKAIVNRHAKDIRTISEIQTFNARGLQPDYDPEGTLDVINSKHILENGLDYGNFEKAVASDWTTRRRARVHRDDILIYTTGANIGRAAIYLSDAPALASNHVNILRVDARNKIYVAFVLNSMIGRLQTEQISTGSAQQELYPKDIDRFYIPFIPEPEQDAISEKVLECYALRAESKRLLALAKTAVETAIEQGEDAGMRLLEEEKAFAWRT